MKLRTLSLACAAAALFCVPLSGASADNYHSRSKNSLEIKGVYVESKAKATIERRHGKLDDQISRTWGEAGFHKIEAKGKTTFKVTAWYNTTSTTSAVSGHKPSHGPVAMGSSKTSGGGSSGGGCGCSNTTGSSASGGFSAEGSTGGD